MASTNPIYTDLNLDFTANPATGDVSKLLDREAIKRSVRNLVLTNNYDVTFMPDLGSGVTGLLFENITPVTAELIKRAIEGVLRRYERRAEIMSVDVLVDPDANGYRADIVFMPINESVPVKVDMFLSRAR